MWQEQTAYRTMAYASSYTGGVEVAVGDVNGDGKLDIITVPSFGPAEVRVFLNQSPNLDPIANSAFKDFVAFPSSFIGGAVVAAADMGQAFGQHLCQHAGRQGGDCRRHRSGHQAAVKVFDVSGTPTAVQTFYPFSTGTTTFSGGVALDVAKIDGDSIPDIVVGAGSYGKSAVEVWGWRSGSPPAAASLTKLQSFTTFADSPAVTCRWASPLLGAWGRPARS